MLIPTRLTCSPNTIWIDLDNTPHVPFFRPIIRELEARGEKVVVSARDAFQVLDVADLHGVRYSKVGRHYGKHPIRKIGGLLWRSLQLIPFVLRHRPCLALSHGSRSQILLSNILRIPSVMIMDYEHARTPLLLRPRWEIVPSALREERLQCQTEDRVLFYEGIKEDVYAPEFAPSKTLPGTLGLDPERIIVTVRPPATEAHYHNHESEVLFIEVMNFVLGHDCAQVVLLPRNQAQDTALRKDFPRWFAGNTVIVPTHAVDGLDLLWHSDLVVSAGGTMNREAAALGVPVYSIFRGPQGAVDRQLQHEGRLVLIRDTEEVKKRVLIRRRDRGMQSHQRTTTQALPAILEHIESIKNREASRSGSGLMNRNKQ